MDSEEKNQDEIDSSVLERPLLDSSSNRTSEKKEKNSEEETNTVVSKGEFAKPSAPKVSDTHSVRSSTRMSRQGKSETSQVSTSSQLKRRAALASLKVRQLENLAALRLDEEKRRREEENRRREEELRRLEAEQRRKIQEAKNEAELLEIEAALLEEEEGKTSGTSLDEVSQKRTGEWVESLQRDLKISNERRDIRMPPRSGNPLTRPFDAFEPKRETENLSGCADDRNTNQETELRNFNSLDYRQNPFHCNPEFRNRSGGFRSDFQPGRGNAYQLEKQKLEKIAIPKFHGDKSKYDYWKTAFMVCVDQSNSCFAEKMIRLENCLSGEAFELIRGLGYTEAAYREALFTLEQHFGGERRSITRHLDALRNMSPMTSGSTTELKKLSNLIRVATVSLRENDRESELGDGMLHSTAKSKLNKVLLTFYKRWILDKEKQENLMTLQEWLIREIRIRSEAEEDAGFIDHHNQGRRSSDNSRTQTESFRGGPERRFAVVTEEPAVENDRKKCPLGDGLHNVENCKKFKMLKIKERWDMWKKKGLCYRCLSSKHTAKTCSIPPGRECGTNGCIKTHHPLLHYESKQQTIESAQNQEGVALSLDADHDNDTEVDNDETGEDFPTVVQNGTTNNLQSDCKVALRTIPAFVFGKKNKKLKINIMLDDGSTGSYIDEDLAVELGLEGKLLPLHTEMLGGYKDVSDSIRTEVEIESLDGNFRSRISCWAKKNVTGRLQSVNWLREKHKWIHLKDIPFQEIAKPEKVDMLIGNDFPELHRSLQEVHAGNGPVARLTPLGWTCVGPVSNTSSLAESNNFIQTLTLHAPIAEVVNKN